jgi:hypothetical protein
VRIEQGSEQGSGGRGQGSMIIMPVDTNSIIKVSLGIRNQKSKDFLLTDPDP